MPFLFNISTLCTFIVGFPGETDRDFEHLLDFLQAAQLDRVGCFQYSPVAGARANQLPGAVPDILKQQRWDQFMQTQQKISRRRMQSRVGNRIEVIVDASGNAGAVARSHADAPEIDGVVTITDGADLLPGQRVDVMVTGADEYDLTALLA